MAYSILILAHICSLLSGSVQARVLDRQQAEPSSAGYYDGQYDAACNPEPTYASVTATTLLSIT
jgi:hypothetical protein